MGWMGGDEMDGSSPMETDRLEAESMTTVLVTGFEPFGCHADNPSWEAALAVDGAAIGQARVVARRLPCVIDAVGPALTAALDEVAPDLVLCLGLAAGRPDITVERIAINVVDARIPDNAGHQPIDVPVVADGPAAYFSTLPIKALVKALHEAGIPASVSQTAGTYACNAVFYHLLHQLAQRGSPARGGFIHLPCLPAMVADDLGMPCLPLETIVAAVRVIAATALTVRKDIALGGGAVH